MTLNNNETRSSILTSLFALAASMFFIPLFITRGAGPLDFWWWMSASLLILIAAGAVLDGDYRDGLRADLAENPASKIGLGLAAALALYIVFAAGNFMSRHIFDFAGRNIDAVYGFRGGASSLRITVLMAIVIGPGEELFWRAFLQRRLSQHLGRWMGSAAATALYTAVHLASGNLMLVLAAMVCGIFWGLLYFRFKSPLINMVSHTVWDIAVFIVFPFSA
ncbi:MAG TPA: type II CAAX endopeptidase family protein [Spirochaetota bacterium]|nr:type II CAAX endopeptidase family protein [Spirochaetota bacterium]HPC42572.1 type II CAAX endopeptidase family protein [Spirochaetota bacterium]HPL15526.1 type II CAAX endopeptidase family protein [Spirochaetota bacterium]HQF10140.1 type II CAAX endopeptidase family protein [Spirochaetota bacterium]HQH98924.1 type II CAAX endopeptidase family protein [Spirochaetota bacterium]